MPRRVVLMDTSFVLALENSRDGDHQRAKLLDQELLGCNAVLALHWGIILEIADGYSRLGRRTKAFE